jgi:16S rRNA (guanine966-N2)-methyltransferase
MRSRRRTVTVGAGWLRGRTLLYPEQAGLRPSMRRTKASVYSSLATWMRDAVVADLYAGAGAFGIEAVSRGAGFVHFVEHDRAALEALRENLRRCGLARDRCRVHDDAVERVLRARPCPLAEAVVVFADPPYDGAGVDEMLRRVDLDALPALEWLVVEHRSRVVVEAPAGLSIERQRRFGDTTVTYFAPG